MNELENIKERKQNKKKYIYIYESQYIYIWIYIYIYIYMNLIDNINLQKCDVSFALWNLSISYTNYVLLNNSNDNYNNSCRVCCNNNLLL